MDAKDLKKAKEFQNLRNSLLEGDDLKDVINQAMEDLKNDPEVYEIIKKLGLTNKDVREHIGMLREFQKDYNVCKNCPGFENCPKEEEHYRISVSNDDGFLERRYSPCEKYRALMQARSRYYIRDFPDEWLGKGLNEIDTTKDRNQIILQMLALASGKSDDWLYITGKVGSGRSYLLACFSNDFGKKCHDAIAFTDTADLVDSLRALSIEDKAKFDKEMARIESCPLLVLDGFGDEYKSDFAFSTVLFPILRERAKNHLITAFSSDFTFGQIEEMYSQKVGRARAHQLTELILLKAKKERKLSGLPLYS